MRLQTNTLILTILFLTGCATTPVPDRLAKPIPQSQVISELYLSKSSDRYEKVLLIRDAGYMGSLLEAVVFVDKTPIASLNTGEKVVFYLAPGKHMFAIQAKRNLLGEHPGESEIDIINGGVNNFRLRMISGDGPRIERSLFLE